MVSLQSMSSSVVPYDPVSLTYTSPSKAAFSMSELVNIEMAYSPASRYFQMSTVGSVTDSQLPYLKDPPYLGGEVSEARLTDMHRMRMTRENIMIQANT